MKTVRNIFISVFVIIITGCTVSDDSDYDLS